MATFISESISSPAIADYATKSISFFAKIDKAFSDHKAIIEQQKEKIDELEAKILEFEDNEPATFTIETDLGKFILIESSPENLTFVQIREALAKLMETKGPGPIFVHNLLEQEVEKYKL